MRADAWMVGFLPSENRGIYRLIAGKSHCFAFRYEPRAACWLLVEHSIVGLDVQALNDIQAEALVESCTTHGSLLVCKGGKKKIVVRPPIFMTCVEVVKSQMGIRDWRIWTPRQLQSALLARGARSF
jgi:hypothetical protein